MNLVRYIDEMNGLAEEIINDLSEDVISRLAKNLNEIGIDKWVVFKQTNMPLIQSYVSATPSQRKQQKRFQSDIRAYIALAAYQECKAAAFMFEQISNKHILDGLPYRNFSSLACEIFDLTANYSSDTVWPDYDSPFDDF